MVRPTMIPLIDYLRKFGQASTTDEFNGVTYWSDDQLEETLDEAAEYYRVKLVTASSLNANLRSLDTYRHYKFESNYKLLNASASEVTVSSTYDHLLNTVLLDSAVSGTLYLEGLKVNMWKALEILWDRKAQQRKDNIDWKAGHNTMYTSQEYRHCISQRDYYANKIIRTFKRT